MSIKHNDCSKMKNLKLNKRQGFRIDKSWKIVNGCMKEKWYWYYDNNSLRFGWSWRLWKETKIMNELDIYSNINLRL